MEHSKSTEHNPQYAADSGVEADAERAGEGDLDVLPGGDGTVAEQVDSGVHEEGVGKIGAKPAPPVAEEVVGDQVQGQGGEGRGERRDGVGAADGH